MPNSATRESNVPSRSPRAAPAVVWQWRQPLFQEPLARSDFNSGGLRNVSPRGAHIFSATTQPKGKGSSPLPSPVASQKFWRWCEPVSSTISRGGPKSAAGASAARCRT